MGTLNLQGTDRAGELLKSRGKIFFHGVFLLLLRQSILKIYLW